MVTFKVAKASTKPPVLMPVDALRVPRMIVSRLVTTVVWAAIWLVFKVSSCVWVLVYKRVAAASASEMISLRVSITVCLTVGQF